MSKKALGKGLGAIFGDDFREEIREPEKKKEEQYVELSLNTGNKTDENTETIELKKEKEENKELYKSSSEYTETNYNSEENSENKNIYSVKISMIEPNRSQPRKKFDEEALTELSESMKKFGVLQPLLVKKSGEFYEIIAGERRWRAAKLAGLKEIPVIIKEIEDKEAAEIAVIENIQREDLSPIEEALAYRRLITEFGLTQEEVAERVSKNRSTITNSLRLLNLDDRVRELLEEGKLSSGHARALLAVENRERQYELAMIIIEKGLNVRETEALIKKEGRGQRSKKISESAEELKLYLDNIAEGLTENLGTKVSIVQGKKSRGKISIEYYSSEDFERITDLLRRK